MLYGLLVGHPVKGSIYARFRANQPHYHIDVRRPDAKDFDIAVNIQSFDGSEVLYAIRPDEAPPHAAILRKLQWDLYALPKERSDYWIDYIRMPLVTRDEMKLLPVESGQDHELRTELDKFVASAIADPQCTIYVYGFVYPTDDGIHQIHMNQGNPGGQRPQAAGAPVWQAGDLPPRGNHSAENAIWHDGAIFAYFPGQDKWWTLLLAFQSQSFNTDDKGNPILSALQLLT
jgi:uncharacterized protein YukJ